jgi:hypothetical protein
MLRLINADGRDVTQQTLRGIRKAITDGNLNKAATITTASGLAAYNLEAPSKELYPVLTPLRNRIRRKNTGVGTGTNWKEVSAIVGSGISSMGWVPEGQRSARMSVVTAPRAANFVTMGEESDVTFEAESAAAGFEDELAANGMRLLNATMIKEEMAILGGNRSVALGKPVTPTIAVDAAGGSIDAGANTKVRVRVVALTLEGYLASSLTAGIQRQASITGMDGKAFTLNGGTSKVSDAAVADIAGAANSLTAKTTVIKGAVGYAWFVELGGAAESLAASHLEAITTINSVAFTTLNGTLQALNAAGMSVASDYSRNEDKAFDGLLYSLFNSSLAYYRSLADGTPGEGTGLTASGRGSIVEIDEMLEAMWAQFRVSPEELYVSAQELRNLTTKTLTASGGSSLLTFVQPNAQGGAPVMMAGNTIGYYYNPFSLDGGQIIPIKLHPNLPPGLIFGWAENLPGQYQAANVPETAAIETRREYYQIDWAPVTRARETGVYVEEVLKVYAPFALCAIGNIANK